MALKVVTPPAVEPVTLQEAKDHLRVDTANEDALISQTIVAARKWCEAYSGLAFVTTVFDYYGDRLPALFELPRAPLQSVESIKHLDADGVLQTVSSSVYRVDAISAPARIALGYGQYWPDTQAVVNSVVVRFTAGYGDAAADVPENLRQAILIMTAELYEQRQQSVAQTLQQVPFTVRALLDTDRVAWF